MIIHNSCNSTTYTVKKIFLYLHRTQLIDINYGKDIDYYLIEIY